MTRRILIALVAALVLAAPAGAGTIVVKLGLVPGKLKVAAAQNSPTSVSLTVADGRGTGAGWTVRSSVPVEVTGISAHCATHSTCTLPTLASAPSGRVVLSAARDTGMGVMNVVVTLKAPPGTRVTFTAS
jgi:hypothetical protein